MLCSVKTLYLSFFCISIAPSLFPICEGIYCLYMYSLSLFAGLSWPWSLKLKPLALWGHWHPVAEVLTLFPHSMVLLFLLLLPFYYACSFFIAFRCLIVACIIFAWLISNSIQIEGEAVRDERITQRDHGMNFSRARVLLLLLLLVLRLFFLVLRLYRRCCLLSDFPFSNRSLIAYFGPKRCGYYAESRTY